MTGLPHFLIIGAARAGTTALYSYLSQHPQVFLTPSKETNFFAYEGQDLRVVGPGAEFINNSITRLPDYQAQFDGAPETTVLGEVCPLYLYEPQAPERIHWHVPNAKLIAILRNPIEQAFSHYLYARRFAIEPLADFTEALALEDKRLGDGWQPLFGYSKFPRYGEQLARYLDQFPREQILIRDYREFRTDNDRVIAEICRFIGVDDSFRADTTREPNAGGTPKNAALHQLIMRPNPLTAAARILPVSWRRAIRDRLADRNLAKGERMPDEARAILRERLADDINRLSDLLDRDYSRWLA